MTDIPYVFQFVTPTAFRLRLYNGALLAAGERELSAIDDDTPSRRYLDQAWNLGFVNEVLETGQWKFARRTQQLTADTDVDPQFGHTYAFAVPSDHLRTVALCSDEFFQVPLLEYQREGGYWMASIDPIYVSFISNDASFGSDLSRWPASVIEYARHLLAQKIIPRLNGNKTDLDRLEKKIRKLLLDAKSNDAMEDPTRFPPAGSWVRSRGGGRSNGDRGSRTSLIG